MGKQKREVSARVQRMRDMVKEMSADSQEIQEKTTEIHERVKRFVVHALSRQKNGAIEIDMEKIPTDREPTLNDLFLAMGGNLNP